MNQVVYRVVNSKGQKLKRPLKNGEQFTIVNVYFEQLKGGNMIPGDERMVIVATPKNVRRG